MPWKECSVIDERGRFVARLLEGEKMAALCRDSGKRIGSARLFGKARLQTMLPTSRSKPNHRY
jgi:hypothetical protein